MFRVSCIQLRSSDNVKNNFLKTEKLIKKAVKQKANLIITPENSSLFSLDKKKLLKICSNMSNDEYLSGIKNLAKKYKKWILVGSVIIKKNSKSLVNRSVLINQKGKINSYYDKIHMYDAKLSKKENYKNLKPFVLVKNIKFLIYPGGKSV